ncbi:MAG: T9SS C-terminal target domain-containing protein, partial [Chlorobi bacterium CHB2]|nr:T9SS C-terminal target domain-containing protein [Chlorobi bacterium CHB2]
SGVEETSDGEPAGFELLQNFPNPFNPETTVRFTVSKTGSYSLKLFSISGEYITEVRSGIYTSGTHQEALRLEGLSSGVYILRLEGAGNSSSLKLTLMK